MQAFDCLVLSRKWACFKGSFKGSYKGSIRGLRVSIGPVWFLVGNGVPLRVHFRVSLRVIL